MGHTDAQGIVYHATYLLFCEAARSEYMRDLELDYGALVTEAGMEMAVSAAWQKYRAPARYDDIVDVWVRVAELRRVRYTFEYELRCRGTNTLLMTAGTEIACIATATRRPARMPQVIIDTIREFENAHLVDRSGRGTRTEA